MTDFFALLGQPRQPWLDEDALKAAFHEKSSILHPDRFHNAEDAARAEAGRIYAELNSAYQCLREPKDRLAHLIELESGRKPGGIQSVPAEAMELFAQVGQLCRETDAFLAESAKATSPMLKVRQFERGLEWTDKIQALMRSLNEQREELHAKLRSMNNSWKGEVAASLPALGDIHSRLSYLNRWMAQLQERFTQLAL
jgi:DnaJ-domain-containing protein 1